MSEALKAALREACAEVRSHNMHAAHITRATRIQEWERLANEPDSIGTSAVVRSDRTTVLPPATEECARCGVVGPVDVACRGCWPDLYEAGEEPSVVRPGRTTSVTITVRCDRDGCESMLEHIGPEPDQAAIDGALRLLGWSVTEGLIRRYHRCPGFR